MKQSISTFITLLVCLTVTQGCVTLYNDYGPSGAYYVACYSGNLPTTYNNQVSAIVIPTGWSATLYDYYNYGGTSLHIGSGTWSAPAAWNNKVSSIKIYPGCPVYYKNYDQKGGYFVHCNSGNVPSGYDNTVSSAYIPPGWDVTLYADANYGGASYHLGPGKWNAPATWNDKVSSIKVNDKP